MTSLEFLQHTVVPLDSYPWALWWYKANANEKRAGLLINTHIHKHMYILISIYYYFAMK